VDGDEAGRRKGGLAGARRDWSWSRGSLPPPSSSEVAEVDAAAGMALVDGRCGGGLGEEGGGRGVRWLHVGRRKRKGGG